MSNAERKLNTVDRLELKLARTELLYREADARAHANAATLAAVNASVARAQLTQQQAAIAKRYDMAPGENVDLETGEIIEGT